ncbi:MAG: sigma-70 family RNA polymerase sigma factor [Anaerolineales bacterium]|nr:sigma-70 family RNA polymerase sigma factor [Anaerolineales bacterium]
MDDARAIEQKWIAGAIAGEEQAFAQLVERYQVPVYNLCFRMLGNNSDAEDASQETFIRAYRSLGRFDPERKFINWVLTIASNYCVDQIRRRRLQIIPLDEIFQGSIVVEPQQGPEGSLMRQENREIIQGLLGVLKPRDRAVVVLRYWYEMSYEEIARTLSITVSAVKSRLHRARRSMAAQWTVHQKQLIAVGGRKDEASAI